MKKLIALLFLIPILSYGQNLPSLSLNPFPKDKDGKISFTFVIESELNTNALFRNAKTWIATTPISFGESRTYTSKITMEDASTGRIIVEYTDNTYIPGRYGSESMTVNSSFKIMFDCKDRKYRYKIEDYIDLLKYGNKEYIKTFESLHKDYEDNNNRAFVLEMKEFFIDMSNSIQKAMVVNDDF